MLKINRALVSVSDKTGLLELAKVLQKFQVEILSTGGTAKMLRDNGINVIDVSSYTGFPEMLDGRVKTLHPKIHGGLLALRDNQEHMQKLKEHNIGLIDMVVVNLYPFEKTIQKPGVTVEEAIENIDIGGPSMLRSAAKNARFVAVIANPGRYPQVIEAMKKNNGSVPRELLEQLRVEVFSLTSQYDSAIFQYFLSQQKAKIESKELPQEITLRLSKIQELRYGENPHQKASFYAESGKSTGIIKAKQLQGKELSFNNILDLNSSWELVSEYKYPAVVIVKHNNPCGVCVASSLEKAFVGAWKCDPLSAFGGIVAFNRPLDKDTAAKILKSGFLECIIAPKLDVGVLELFSAKKNLRILELSGSDKNNELDIKRVGGGFLVQDKDLMTLDENNLKIVTKRKPSKKEMESLIFGWIVAKHVKSNAIILTSGTRTVGIGAGQMSRVDSVAIAKAKSGKLSKNSCLASDAFFPKEDAVIKAAKAGVKAIIQPGGSIADEAIIKAADKYKIAMVFTGMRHFRH